LLFFRLKESIALLEGKMPSEITTMVSPDVSGTESVAPSPLVSRHVQDMVLMILNSILQSRPEGGVSTAPLHACMHAVELSSAVDAVTRAIKSNPPGTPAKAVQVIREVLVAMLK
jgi:hypothetical protein